MPFVAATRSLGRAGLFSLSVLRASKPTADFFAELVREIYKIGARSLPIIAVGGAFVGLSVTLLGYRALETYGAAEPDQRAGRPGPVSRTGAGADRAAVHRPRRQFDRRRARA